MKLRRQLRKVGAGELEADKLADIAKTLKRLEPRGLSAEAKKRLAPEPNVAKVPHTLRWTMAGSFASVCLLVVIAQNSLPGSLLYGLKRKTEAARTLVQPDYEDILVEKREEEVETLIKKDKVDPAVLEQAEKNYQETFEKSYDKWQDGQNNTTLPEKIKPRYNWSRNWYQSRNSTQNTEVRGTQDVNKTIDRATNLLP